MQQKIVTVLIAFGFGVYLVIQGVTAEFLIDETEGIATEKQKERWKATPATQTLVISAGIAAIGYGVYRCFHQQN